MRLQISAAVLCILLIFTAAAVNYRCMDRFIASCCDEIEKMCRDEDADRGRLERLWRSKQPWLETVVHHDLLRDAEDALAQFSAAADHDELISSAAMLRSALYHIRSMEKLSVGNIL